MQISFTINPRLVLNTSSMSVRPVVSPLGRDTELQTLPHRGCRHVAWQLHNAFKRIKLGGREPIYRA